VLKAGLGAGLVGLGAWLGISREGPKLVWRFLSGELCGEALRLPKAPKVPELEVIEVTGRAAVTSVPSSHYDSYTIPIQ
jgi:hypothetical protein